MKQRLGSLWDMEGDHNRTIDVSSNQQSEVLRGHRKLVSGYSRTKKTSIGESLAHQVTARTLATPASLREGGGGPGPGSYNYKTAFPNGPKLSIQSKTKFDSLYTTKIN